MNEFANRYGEFFSSFFKDDYLLSLRFVEMFSEADLTKFQIIDKDNYLSIVIGFNRCDVFCNILIFKSRVKIFVEGFIIVIDEIDFESQDGYIYKLENVMLEIFRKHFKITYYYLKDDNQFFLYKIKWTNTSLLKNDRNIISVYKFLLHYLFRYPIELKSI